LQQLPKIRRLWLAVKRKKPTSQVMLAKRVKLTSSKRLHVCCFESRVCRPSPFDCTWYDSRMTGSRQQIILCFAPKTRLGNVKRWRFKQ